MADGSNHIPPRLLYKYVTFDRIDVLQRLRIRFTQPNALNDPFEFSPVVRAIQHAEVAEAELRQGMSKTRILDLVRNGLPPELRDSPELNSLAIALFQSDEFRQLTESLIPEALQYLQAATPHIVGPVIERLGNEVGILSLSEVPDQMPMWAHYAGNGTGFLIVFDASHSWFHQRKTPQDDLRHLERVRYVDSRIPQVMVDLTAEEVLYTKLSGWSCEREWRIVRPLAEATERIGDDIYLYAVPASAIVKVIAGFNTKPSTMAALADVCRNTNLQHVRIEQARLDRLSSCFSFHSV